MNWQHLDYSALLLPGKKWWQDRSFQITAIVSTFAYIVLLILGFSTLLPTTDLINIFSALTAIYVLALTIKAAITSTRLDSKRSLNRIQQFSKDNHLAFENLSKIDASTSITGQNISTNSIVLETVHHILTKSRSNQKLWELSGNYNGTPFKIYTLFLAVRFGAKSPRWYHASVIQTQLSTQTPPFIALAKKDWLSSYIREQDMESYGLQRVVSIDDGFIYYQPHHKVEAALLSKDLTELVSSIDSRSIEVAGRDLYIMRGGGFQISEKEIRQTFQIIDTLSHRLAASSPVGSSPTIQPLLNTPL